MIFFKKTTILLIIFISSLVPLFSFEAGAVDFNIRFFDRRIYYAGTDPIFVQVTINNNSPNTYRFKLADDRAFSVDFDIRTMTNRTLEASDIMTRKRTLHQQIFFREVAIEPGESFSFVEDLRDFVNINQSGSYRVRAIIYPELFRTGTTHTAMSNYLILNVSPPMIRGDDGIPIELDVDTGAVLVRQPLPPDEVVSYMIRARQTSQWERFFLYLDIEAMLSRDAGLRRRYLAENEEGRRRMVTEYRQNMRNSVVDGGISVIPTTFSVERTIYSNNEATVTVLARFRNPTFTELVRYDYYLERRDNIWVIVNYTAEGMGTESNN